MRAVRLGGIFMLRQLAFWNKNICPIFAFLDKLYYLFIPLFLLQLLDFLSFFFNAVIITRRAAKSWLSIVYFWLWAAFDVLSWELPSTEHAQICLWGIGWGCVAPHGKRSHSHSEQSSPSECKVQSYLLLFAWVVFYRNFFPPVFLQKTNKALRQLILLTGGKQRGKEKQRKTSLQ